MVADGFRNPYGFDFTADGEPFTFDSDNERCVGLPWYEAAGSITSCPAGITAGWPRSTRRPGGMPPYFLDVVAPIRDLGRGSPTGVAVLPASAVPGEIPRRLVPGRLDLRPHLLRDTEAAGRQLRRQAGAVPASVGEHGFAPTALAVHPKTGDLYVSIGGRGTRGAVYRISYPAGERTGFCDSGFTKTAAGME